MSKSVDLTKLEINDTVIMRNGGKNKVTAIDSVFGRYSIQFAEYGNHTDITARADGTRYTKNIKGYDDIVKVRKHWKNFVKGLFK